MVTNGRNLEGCSGIETHALRSISTLYSKGNVFFHKIIENQRYRWPSWLTLAWRWLAHLLREQGTDWEDAIPLPSFPPLQTPTPSLLVHLKPITNGCQCRWPLNLDDLMKKTGYCECVVPENIHTPTTEDSLIWIPPPPQDFLFQGVFDDPPPPRNFQNF